MNPETAEAIRIADKHLAGASVERRKALANEIGLAIIQLAGPTAVALMEAAMARQVKCADCAGCSCKSSRHR